MNGQRQIFTLVVLIIFIFTFSYFKNVIKRDKQLKLQRELETKAQFEEKLKEEMKIQLEKNEKHQKLLERMKEHYNICYNIHVLVFKPEEEISVSILNETEESSETLNLKEEKVENAAKEETKTGTPEAKLKNNVVSEPIIYLFLLVLIYSLIKAATDISQHFNKNQKEEDYNDRRKSLQEYAAVKTEAKNVKAPLMRRSTVLGMDVRPKPFNRLLEERRLTRTIPGMSYSGLVTEPGTPAKITNGLAIKPPPLLRRCSVPAFMLQSMGHGGMLRRPSIDSFSEDDSSPDVKRRVRMIHRH